MTTLSVRGKILAKMAKIAFCVIHAIYSIIFHNFCQALNRFKTN